MYRGKGWFFNNNLDWSGPGPKARGHRCPSVGTHRAKIDPGALDPQGSGGVQAGPKVSTGERA